MILGIKTLQACVRVINSNSAYTEVRDESRACLIVATDQREGSDRKSSPRCDKNVVCVHT